MPIRVNTSVDEIRLLLDRVLAHDPLRNTVFGSIDAGLSAPDAAPWAAHPEGCPLVLAARSQGGTPVSVTSGWSAKDAESLSTTLAKLDPPVAAVMGPVDSALAITLPGPMIDRRDERLFRLDTLIRPTGVAGAPRLAVEADRDLVVDWLHAFRLESLGRLPADYDARSELARRWPVMRYWLWEVPDGSLASMAGAQATNHGTARVGPVYTPPHLRGHGFGSAVTASATEDILRRPATACLFTDLANPTSNKIYQAIGYQAVADFTELRLR